MSFFQDGVIRSVGGFTADVTIEEDATDDLTITKLPVEQGAAITDHAYKEPARLVVRAGWTNSSLAAIGDPNFVANIYDQLLTLQVSRVPFTVQTGKRLYNNMLIASLRQITNEDTENSLVAEMILQEVIIVPTETTAVGNRATQAQPEKTAATTSTGTKQLQQAPTYQGGPV